MSLCDTLAAGTPSGKVTNIGRLVLKVAHKLCEIATSAMTSCFSMCALDSYVQCYIHIQQDRKSNMQQKVLLPPSNMYKEQCIQWPRLQVR